MKPPQVDGAQVSEPQALAVPVETPQANGCVPDRNVGVNCRTDAGYFHQCEVPPTVGPQPSDIARCFDAEGVERMVTIATGEIVVRELPPRPISAEMEGNIIAAIAVILGGLWFAVRVWVWLFASRSAYRYITKPRE